MISHINKPDGVLSGGSGFDATAWRGRTGTEFADQVYVSLRGTEGEQDFLADINLASPFGIARNQIVDMVNWWNQITTPTNQHTRQHTRGQSQIVFSR